MKQIPNEKLLATFHWRYATKKFDPTRKISAEDWATLEQSLVLSPSSFGLQGWRFYVVTDQKLKAQLPPVSWGQGQPAEASHLVVLTVKRDLVDSDIDHYINRIAEVRGVTADSLAGFGKVIKGFVHNPPPGLTAREWLARQAYIAMGNLMTSAALLGIDSCPMEGLDPAKYDEILGIAKDGYATVAAVPLGYRAADDKYAALPKVRFPASEVIKHLA